MDKREVRIISIPTSSKEDYGSLTVIEGAWIACPFDIKRVFFIHHVPSSAIRGGHAHKICEQMMTMAVGSVTVATIFEGIVSRWNLKQGDNSAIYIPPEHIVWMYDFSPDAVILVLASEHFSKEDYIYYDGNKG